MSAQAIGCDRCVVVVAGPRRCPRPHQWRHVVDDVVTMTLLRSLCRRCRRVALVGFVLVVLAIVSRCPHWPSRRVVIAAVVAIASLVFATTRWGLAASIRARMNTMVLVKDDPLGS